MEAAGAVFLPAAGIRGGTTVTEVGLEGYYWSSTPDVEYDPSSISMSFYCRYLNGNDFPLRYRGLSVRPVRDNN